MRIPVGPVHDYDGDGNSFTYELRDAAAETVRKVVTQSSDITNGRSQWLWIRLPSGALFLGCQADDATFCDVTDAW